MYYIHVKDVSIVSAFARELQLPQIRTERDHRSDTSRLRNKPRRPVVELVLAPVTTDEILDDTP